MLIERMSFLKSLLLISLLAFPAANAIPKSDTENLCKETTSPAFCLQILETDPRISAARDLSDVLVIAVHNLIHNHFFFLSSSLFGTNQIARLVSKKKKKINKSIGISGKLLKYLSLYYISHVT